MAASGRIRGADDHGNRDAFSLCFRRPCQAERRGLTLCQRLRSPAGATAAATETGGVARGQASDSSGDDDGFVTVTSGRQKRKASRSPPSVSPPLSLSEGWGKDSTHDAEVARQLRGVKESFAELSHRDFGRARAATNPYERLGTGPFVNRSALKLVELDHAFSLLTPRTPGEVFTWVDVCGGPGGFSEYIVWRHAQERKPCRGWGMTLRDEVCDWKIDGGQSFSITYGEDGTGDVYNEANLRELARLALSHDHAREGDEGGVELVLGDGGTQDARDRHDQEALCERLLLCQMAAMTLTLRDGGTWVCKAFTMHGSFTVGLYALASHVFDEVYITKPVTSRPASAERYLVCRGFDRSCAQELAHSLLALNASMGARTHMPQTPSPPRPHGPPSPSGCRDSTTPSVSPCAREARRTQSPSQQGQGCALLQKCSGWCPLFACDACGQTPEGDPKSPLLPVAEDALAKDTALLSHVRQANNALLERELGACERIVGYVRGSRRHVRPLSEWDMGLLLTSWGLPV